MRYELRELREGFEVLPALCKSDKKKELVKLWLGYDTVIVDTFTDKRTKKMIHGEPQAAQDERKRLCEIVKEKYKPKKYILKIFGAKSTYYYHDKNKRTSDVNKASKLELKFATSFQKQIKLKTEIIQL